MRFDREKEGDLLDFIDDNGTTRAGYIKFIIRHYMNSMQTSGQQSPTVPVNKTEKEEPKPSQKKRLPTLGGSFSSKDFEN